MQEVIRQDDLEVFKRIFKPIHANDAIPYVFMYGEPKILSYCIALNYKCESGEYRHVAASDIKPEYKRKVLSKKKLQLFYFSDIASGGITNVKYAKKLGYIFENIDAYIAITARKIAIARFIHREIHIEYRFLGLYKLEIVLNLYEINPQCGIIGKNKKFVILKLILILFS